MATYYIGANDAYSSIGDYRNTTTTPNYTNENIPPFLRNNKLRELFNKYLKSNDNADLFYRTFKHNTEPKIKEQILNYDYSQYRQKGFPATPLNNNEMKERIQQIYNELEPKPKKEEPKEEPKEEKKEPEEEIDEKKDDKQIYKEVKSQTTNLLQNTTKELKKLYHDNIDIKNEKLQKFIDEYIVSIYNTNKNYIDKIKQLKDVERAQREINLEQFLDKKYKSPLKVWELYTANPIFTNIGYYYVLQKHNNDCIIITPLNLMDLEKKDKAIKLYIRLNNLTDSVEIKFPILEANLEDERDYFEAVKKCKDNFVALPISIKMSGTKTSGHANMIIINKKLKKAYRFEPHGSQTRVSGYANLFEEMDTQLEKIFKKYDYEYERSSTICPRRGFQSLEGDADYKGLDESGYCQMWSLFFLDLVLTYPNKDMDELVNKSLLVLEKEPTKLKEFIRNYTSKFLAILEELLDKLSEGQTPYFKKKMAEFMTDKKNIENSSNSVWDRVIDLINEMTIEQASIVKPNNIIDTTMSGGNRFSRMTLEQRIRLSAIILSAIQQSLTNLKNEYSFGVINQDKYLKEIQKLTDYSKEFEPRPFERYFTNQEKQVIKNELQDIKQQYTNEFYRIKNEEHRQKIDKKSQEKFLKKQSKNIKKSEEDEKESIREATNQPPEIVDMIYKYSRDINQDDLINQNDNENNDEEEDMDGSGKSNYALHAVIVKKPVKLERAQEIAHNFIDKSKKYYRETGTSYRFRNIPKQSFIPKSYRTKKVNKQISLIYGELKDPRVQGSGLKDLWEKAKKKFNEIKEGIRVNPVLGILGEPYCGPGTKLEGQRPISTTSKICHDHDYRYNTIEKAKKAGISRKEREDMMRDADEIMLRELDNTKETKLRDKIVHTISKAGIKAKVWAEDNLGLDKLRFAGGLYYQDI
jgi:hypothetical protein